MELAFCLFTKRLEEGGFRWPKIEDGVMRLTPSQLSALIEGLDWTRVREDRGSARRRKRHNSLRQVDLRGAREDFALRAPGKCGTSNDVTADVDNLPADPEALRALLIAERAQHAAERDRLRAIIWRCSVIASAADRSISIPISWRSAWKISSRVLPRPKPKKSASRRQGKADRPASVR